MNGRNRDELRPLLFEFVTKTASDLSVKQHGTLLQSGACFNGWSYGNKYKTIHISPFRSKQGSNVPSSSTEVHGHICRRKSILCQLFSRCNFSVSILFASIAPLACEVSCGIFPPVGQWWAEVSWYLVRDSNPCAKRCFNRKGSFKRYPETSILLSRPRGQLVDISCSGGMQPGKLGYAHNFSHLHVFLNCLKYTPRYLAALSAKPDIKILPHLKLDPINL